MRICGAPVENPAKRLRTADVVALEGDLRCPVCLDVVQKPVSQCCNGHLRCSRHVLDKCPVCREEQHGAVNLRPPPVCDTLLQMLPWKCEDCGAKGVRANVHEHLCPKRAVRCLACMASICREKLIEHMDAWHPGDGLHGAAWEVELPLRSGWYMTPSHSAVLLHCEGESETCGCHVWVGSWHVRSVTQSSSPALDVFVDLRICPISSWSDMHKLARSFALVMDAQDGALVSVSHTVSFPTDYALGAWDATDLPESPLLSSQAPECFSRPPGTVRVRLPLDTRGFHERLLVAFRLQRLAPHLAYLSTLAHSEPAQPVGAPSELPPPARAPSEAPHPAGANAAPAPTR